MSWNECRLMNSPITLSWIATDFEKPSVLRCNRLSCVRRFKFCRSILCVNRLEMRCLSVGNKRRYAPQSSVQNKRIFRWLIRSRSVAKVESAREPKAYAKTRFKCGDQAYHNQRCSDFFPTNDHCSSISQTSSNPLFSLMWLKSMGETVGGSSFLNGWSPWCCWSSTPVGSHSRLNRSSSTQQFAPSHPVCWLHRYTWAGSNDGNHNNGSAVFHYGICRDDRPFHLDSSDTELTRWPLT